jgi:tRNA dimethylallyltransferase
VDPGVIAVVGATATGKSALALRLAEKMDGEIVNADALQVYRGFDIGTAKPSLAERRGVPHHLVDILDPEETWSAGEFARRARTVLDGIRSRGRTAIVAGGSGLYLRALWSGIAPLPASDPALRADLEDRLASDGIAALAADLRERDPVTADRIGARDTQRILRALEVERATGVPLSEWLRRAPFGSRALSVRKVGLTLPRAVLYDRIEARAHEMVRRGWIEEVSRLLASGVAPDAPAFQAIGYAQWVEVLAGRVSREAAFRECVVRTRRFAKRQETWFRREAGIEWLDGRLQVSELAAIVTGAGSACGGRQDE